MRCPVNIHENLSRDKTSTRRVRVAMRYCRIRLIIIVLGSHTRLFKEVFSRANIELMDVFGMQMIELPKAERVTLRQKRGTFLTSPHDYNI